MSLRIASGETGAAEPTPTCHVFTHEAMATRFEFRVYAASTEQDEAELGRVADQAFAAIDDLERRISAWLPDSQTTYLNNHAAERPTRVAPDILDLLSYVQKVHRETDGAFDPTVGPLIKLWGFYKGQGCLPTCAELEAALACVGMQRVSVDRAARTVSFARRGMRLDFGGIGKGLALDRAAEVLKAHGVSAALLEGGTSTVVALGAPPDQPGWTVRIRDPYNKDKHIDEVVLRDASLSTSGGNEKFFELDGKRYCHIFDPRTGRPIEGMLSATAIAHTGTQSDALSTAFFVMGCERTRAYCRAHPDVRAILIPEPEGHGLRPERINFDVEEEQP